jgi:hypothetical protein
MRTTVGALLVAVALGGCAKHDAKAEQEREQTRMMEKLLEAAERDGLDAGAGPAPHQRRTMTTK